MLTYIINRYYFCPTRTGGERTIPVGQTTNPEEIDKIVNEWISRFSSNYIVKRYMDRDGVPTYYKLNDSTYIQDNRIEVGIDIL